MISSGARPGATPVLPPLQILHFAAIHAEINGYNTTGDSIGTLYDYTNYV